MSTCEYINNYLYHLSICADVHELVTVAMVMDSFEVISFSFILIVVQEKKSEMLDHFLMIPMW